jgi:hypothetical protein
VAGGWAREHWRAAASGRARERVRRHWQATTGWHACGRWRAGVRAAATKAGGQAVLAWMRVGGARVEAGCVS